MGIKTDYYDKLCKLIIDSRSVDDFIELYKSYYNVENVPQSAIDDYKRQIKNVDFYEDDWYEEEYEDEDEIFF